MMNGSRNIRAYEYQGYLYLPGYPWTRLNLATLAADRISGRLSNQYRSVHLIGASSHYGLLGYDDGGGFDTTTGTYYKITVADE
jgi:hypothetical protein